MNHHAPRSRIVTVAGALALTGLLAAGCGSASDNEDGGGSGDTVPQGVSETDTTIAASGEPQRGGKLTYALEAETDGFLSSSNRWAISGTMVALAIYDPLTALDENADAQPYLAESIEPDETAENWTLTLREGVTFHDGTPVDADAIKANLEAHMDSILTGSAIAPVETVTVVDDRTVEIAMKIPWVAFDAALTSQLGFVQAPSQMADPDGNRKPVGSGPFSFVSWTTDSSLSTTRNESYWREGLPYLDEVEFRPVRENQTRVDQLITGQINMLHQSDPGSVKKLREHAANGEIQLVEDRGEGEEGFVMLNMSKAPLDDVRVRRAIALATDQQTYNENVDDGVPQIATGPFKPDSPWRVETDYPTFDLAEAQALVEEYEAEVGPVSFALGTTDNPDSKEAIQVLANMWEQAGMDVELVTTDQANFIGDALAGNYDANLWRQFGAPDPDQDFVWWAWKTPDGDDNFLNFARLHDEQIDEALLRGRSSSDLEERKAAYADFQVRLTELVPYIWLGHSTWVVAAANDVRDITNGELPDGSPSLPMGGTGTFGGTHRLTQVWIEK